MAEKKKVTLARFLDALGILHVGEETAITLARNFEFPHIGQSIAIDEILKFFKSCRLTIFNERPMLVRRWRKVFTIGSANRAM